MNESVTAVPPGAIISLEAGHRAVPVMAEHAIDGGGADGQNTITIRLAKLQSAMLLKSRQQGRDR
ncbi:hypothetical protein XH98_20645 [Bradyrhizobium sp. CCBAU 51745]|nr:hypothetical protein [Bradyrhizobium sp. CCBAU 51745]